ncbi:hypothetical protein NPIL_272541 [Nephila pilipes]|uniref:Uncharacterized protein n=1 Tax=Nephila pilipes TaxID=299642 RepID=A0A8X6UBB9_NEPPI|nr:hypothetical protein NPIL_272541 [Nephila pilipes]
MNQHKGEGKKGREHLLSGIRPGQRGSCGDEAARGCTTGVNRYPSPIDQQTVASAPIPRVKPEQGVQTAKCSSCEEHCSKCEEEPKERTKGAREGSAVTVRPRKPSTSWQPHSSHRWMKIRDEEREVVSGRKHRAL